MDVPGVLLCERCRRPTDPGADHVVRQIRDEAHPLPAVREHEVFPIVTDPPTGDEHRRE